MHQQHAIDRRVGQRQFDLVDQRRQRRPRGRPFHHALRRRHEGEAALGLLAEQAEIGRGVADAEHALAGVSRHSAADAAADEAARHHAEPLAVEIAQIDDVDRHGCEMYHETLGEIAPAADVQRDERDSDPHVTVNAFDLTRIAPCPRKPTCFSA